MEKETGLESTLYISYAKLTITSFRLKTNNFYHYWYKVRIHAQEGAEGRNILNDVTNLRFNSRIPLICTSAATGI